MKSRFVNNNPAIACLLSLVLLMATGMQMAHDLSVDHQHTSDCFMCAVDNHSNSSQPEFTIPIKQTVITTPSVAKVLYKTSNLTTQARAPPAC